MRYEEANLRKIWKVQDTEGNELGEIHETFTPAEGLTRQVRTEVDGQPAIRFEAAGIEHDTGIIHVPSLEFLEGYPFFVRKE